MKYFSLLIIVLLFSCSTQNKQQYPVNIIPQPNYIETFNGNFTVSEKINVHVNSEELKPVLDLFASDIKDNIEIISEKSKKAELTLQLNISDKKDESYQLQITKKGILISAGNTKGIFYGLQSLKQMLLFSEIKKDKISLPLLTINDVPRFEWRGIMLDESRHFFGIEKVKQLLDIMAMHKLNIFHWHLTDVPGWRIEIKKYPKLTSIGGLGDHQNPDAPAQFYTQEEIKEIVKYASERFIEVIPEIDMPGHASAANRAYPEYSGGGSKSHPEFTFNPGNEKTYTYLTDILWETTSLFPSDFIHLGGDEVHFGNESWNTDPYVINLMKKENLKDLKAVESYFVKRMADSIQMLHKTTVGWDEIVDHNLQKENSLVMWWRHNLPEKLEASLTKGYQVILCPRIPLYFDFDQDINHTSGRKWGGAFSSLELTYAFPPDTLPGFIQNQKLVKGLQANVWSERIHDIKRLDFMLHPRLSAMSESTWTNAENKKLNDFQRRLKNMLYYFEKENIYFYNPFQPDLTPEPPDLNK